MGPGVHRDFLFELTGAPSGVSDRENEAAGRRPGWFSAANVGQHFFRRGQADVFSKGDRRIETIVERVQNYAAFGLHRPAKEYRRFGGARLRFYFELLQKVAKLDLREGFIDDNAHRVILVMGTHKDDRPFETRIAHIRHGDQHFPVQKIAV